MTMYYTGHPADAPAVATDHDEEGCRQTIQAALQHTMSCVRPGPQDILVVRLPETATELDIRRIERAALGLQAMGVTQPMLLLVGDEAHLTAEQRERVRHWIVNGGPL